MPDDEQALLQRAIKASEGAYAPYSAFYVGAALILDSGEIITGNNQENAAYPLGLCAERVAFFAAMANHPKAKIIKCAIYAHSENIRVDEPVAPCGACRQAMSEYEDKQRCDITLVLSGQHGKIARIHGVHELLPLRFGRKSLGKD
ncbi:MAG: cytidine deaminase [Flavobacteriales bacterium]